MGKIKLIIGAVLALAVVSAAGTSLVQAQTFRGGDTVTVAKGETVDSTLFVSGRTVTIDNDVNGDVFCAGQTVTITGTIRGDVLCAGQTVTVKGKVEGDVRLAGQTVLLGATVDGSASVGAQSFVLESTGSVGRDLTLGGNSATLEGKVGRDNIVRAEDMTVAGVVGRNIKGETTHLRLDSQARVGGNIDYASQNTLQQAHGAEVAGKITKSEPAHTTKQKQEETPAAKLSGLLYWFVALLIAAMAVVLLVPRVLQTVTDRAFPSPWKALLAGFLTAAAVPVALVLLAITVIGLPLALTLLVVWIAIMLLAGPVFAYYIGRLILRSTIQPLLVMLVGASTLIVGSVIPFINIFVFLATIWFGTGMIVLEVFKRTSKPQPKGAKK